MQPDPLEGRIKVRDLIENCVREELDGRQRPKTFTVPTNWCEWVLDQDREIGAMALEFIDSDVDQVRVKAIDTSVEGAVTRALEAFCEGRIEILLNGVALTDLDESIDVTYEDSLIFLPKRTVRGL